jgi:hypothetical protein
VKYKIFLKTKTKMRPKSPELDKTFEKPNKTPAELVQIKSSLLAI